MKVDTDNTILVVDEGYRAVYRMNPLTGIPTPISGQTFSSPNYFVNPTDVNVYNAATSPKTGMSTADLSVTKDDGVTTVTAGDNITHT